MASLGRVVIADVYAVRGLLGVPAVVIADGRTPRSSGTG